jgi:pimeloyl-ACP methyl ester carboxylesterase
MKHLVVFLHGIGGSSRDWTCENDYTHGHLLLQQVAKANWLYRCYDLYGHGEWKANEPDFNPEYIDDKAWPKFIQESELGILAKIEKEIEDNPVDRLILVSYSGSAIISLRIANRINPDLPCICVMAAPDPAREYDDEYSLHNQINRRSIDYLIICGKDDEEINIDDLKYVYEQINGRKELVELKGGHSIDAEWTEIAFNKIMTMTAS